MPSEAASFSGWNRRCRGWGMGLVPPTFGRERGPAGAERLEAGKASFSLEKLSQNEPYGQWEVAWQKSQAPGDHWGGWGGVGAVLGRLIRL